jgi:uncharacterized YigZ family protein
MSAMSADAVPARQATAELREKGSRFLAVVGPASGEEEARAALAALARLYPDATHLCWAWRLGRPPRERSADAGEPAGTAGAPMLRVLRDAGLSDVLAVVARWFGGVKLGKGGLARADAGAVRAALDGLPIEHRVVRVRLTLSLPLAHAGAIKRLIHPPEVELESETYGAEATLVLLVEEGRRAALEQKLANLHIEIR